MKTSKEEIEVSIFVLCDFFPPVEESLTIVSWPGYKLVNPRDLCELISQALVSDFNGMFRHGDYHVLFNRVI